MDPAGGTERVATIHYRRPAGDYGDYSSSDSNDFWGLHIWGGAADPDWTTPRKPARTDPFGMVFDVPLFGDAQEIGYILHRGDDKELGPDQGIVFARDGYEIWQIQVWVEAAGMAVTPRADVPALCEFREVLARTFLAVADDRATSRDDLDVIGVRAARAKARRKLRLPEGADSRSGSMMRLPSSTSWRSMPQRS